MTGIASVRLQIASLFEAVEDNEMPKDGRGSRIR